MDEIRLAESVRHVARAEDTIMRQEAIIAELERRRSGHCDGNLHITSEHASEVARMRVDRLT